MYPVQSTVKKRKRGERERERQTGEIDLFYKFWGAVAGWDGVGHRILFSNVLFAHLSLHYYSAMYFFSKEVHHSTIARLYYSKRVGKRQFAIFKFTYGNLNTSGPYGV